MPKNSPEHYRSPLRKESNEEIARRIVGCVRRQPYISRSQISCQLNLGPDRILRVMKEFNIVLTKRPTITAALEKLREVAPLEHKRESWGSR